ncbi:MAG TPA: IclR family transcriptional regulator [Methylomirabilota bacterium]|nr:IclR family transcriptional regulator [Methylomirabilota bacterium]
MSRAAAREAPGRPRRRSAGAHRAAGRVVDILESVVGSREGLPLRELTAQLEAPKSSLLPLLRTLAARGYLEQGPLGEYRLGRRALELGVGARAHRELPEIARPALRALMQRTGETVFLGTLSGDGTAVVFVDKVDSDQVIRYTGGVGERRALHATSSGKVILAFLPPPRREKVLRTLPLKRYTDCTVTSLPALRASLEEVRRSGVCFNLDELAVGAAGIAAPIFDRDGQVVGACAIGAPTDRVRSRLKSLAAEVRAAARTISAGLGHRPQPPAPGKDQP